MKPSLEQALKIRQDVELVKESFATGLTLTETARKLGTYPQHIYWLAKRFNLTPYKKPKPDVCVICGKNPAPCGVLGLCGTHYSVVRYHSDPNRRNYERAYRLKNQEHLREYNRNYRLKNKQRFVEHRRDNHRKYYLKNQQRLREYQRTYYLKNRQYYIDYQRRYYLSKQGRSDG